MNENQWMGAFDLNKVLQLWPERETIFSHSAIDLSQITTVDSSGCAFLVQWAVHLHEKQQKLQVQHLPEQGRRLMRLYGVESLFNFSN